MTVTVAAAADSAANAAGQNVLDRPLASYAIGRLARVIARELEPGLLELGGTLPQYNALSVLSRGQPLSNAELARLTLVRPQSMTGVMKALEAQGLVERRPELRQGRTQRALLRPRGVLVLEAMDGVVAAVEDDMCSGLRPEDREWLRRALLGSLRALGAQTVVDERQDSNALDAVAPLPERREESEPEPLRIAQLLEFLDRALVQRLEEARADHGLALPQYTALLVLLRYAGLSTAELARQAAVRPQSMAEVVSVLESNGLIERDPDADHKRILRVRHTAAGRHIALAYRTEVSKIEEQMYGWLPEGGYSHLSDLFVSCLESMGVGYGTPA